MYFLILMLTVWICSLDEMTPYYFVLRTKRHFCISAVCKTYADIVLVMDSSGSIGAANYKQMLQFAVSITEKFTLGIEDVQFAQVIFGANAYKKFDFNTHKTFESLKKVVIITIVKICLYCMYSNALISLFIVLLVFMHWIFSHLKWITVFCSLANFNEKIS